MSDSDDDAPRAGARQTHHEVKIVVVGDGTTGKTSLVKRTTADDFGREYQQTLGVDFSLKHMSIGERVPQSVDAKIWDIGGQTLGGQMLPQYLYNCNAVLFVYDMTNLESFRNLADWLDAVKGILEQQRSDDETRTSVKRKDPHFALVANKADLDYQKSVPRKDHLEYAKAHSMSGHFVSSRTGENVDLMFKLVVARALGLHLTKREIEFENRPIVAPIMAGGDDGLRRGTSTSEATAVTAEASSSSAGSASAGSAKSQKKPASKSSICSVQ